MSATGGGVVIYGRVSVFSNLNESQSDSVSAFFPPSSCGRLGSSQGGFCATCYWTGCSLFVAGFYTVVK